jgi:hypothetical protein
MLYFCEIQYKKRLGLSLNTTENDRKLLFLSQAKNIVHNGVKSIMKSNWNCSFNIQITKVLMRVQM